MCHEGGAWGSRTPQEIFDQIHELLDVLAGEEVGSGAAEALGDDIKALERIGNRIDAESCRRLRYFDRHQGYAASGALTAQAWLRWQCRLTAASAAERVHVARRLACMPMASESFALGAISHRHAVVIGETASQLGDNFDAIAEATMVDSAKANDPWWLRRTGMNLRHVADPDGVLEDANHAYGRRYMYLSETYDGLFRIDGWLDAEGGASLRTILDAAMGPRQADDDRKECERRADALVDCARRLLDSGQLPEAGGQKPHLSVIVDMSTLSREPGSLPAELEWSEPIPAESARRLACDSAITPIINGLGDRTDRVIPGAMRRALVARDRGCRFPGCGRPPAWTDAHHIKHWADGGATSMDNVTLLCRRHHRRVHEEGWRLVWGAKEELVAVPP